MCEKWEFMVLNHFTGYSNFYADIPPQLIYKLDKNWVVWELNSRMADVLA